jgi:outer membrane protein OmpA-like peptidoglycan-associated protein
MKIKRAMSLASLSVCMAGMVVGFGGCSSVPKPAVPDGSSRVPANEPERVQALQQRVAQDRALLTENNLLKAQVDVLQQKLTEMTTIVREALLLPPAASARAQAAPSPVAPAPAAPAAQPLRQSMALPSLPAHAYSTNASGVVIRVFHPFARTDFEPSEPVAQALRAGVQGAERIDVRGYTDSNVVNPIDRLIAIERAEKARTWLINNGAEAAKIYTQHFTARHFYTDNGTKQGRSLNRRVEIDIHNPQLNGNRVALGE